MKFVINLLVVAFVIVFAQCSKDSTPNINIETPLSRFIRGGTWSYTQINDGSTYSVGNKFSVLKNGAVISLGLTSPVAGTFDVALYEVGVGNSPTLLGSKSVTITQTEIDAGPNIFKYANLDAGVSLMTGKTYCIAYSTNANAKILNRLDVGSSNPNFGLPVNLMYSQVSIQGGAYGTAGAFPATDQTGSIFMADVRFQY